MSEAKFEIEISNDLIRFAKISGDWNPMHTDLEYAKTGPYKERILHQCLLRRLIFSASWYVYSRSSMPSSWYETRFVAPIIPLTEICVSGNLSGENRVEVTISDRNTGQKYTEGSYEFSLLKASENLWDSNHFQS